MKHKWGAVFLRQSLKSYYCKCDGKFVKLCSESEGKDRAEEVRKAKIAEDDIINAQDPSSLMSAPVKVLVDHFIKAKTDTVEPKTLHEYTRILSQFADKFGGKRYYQLERKVIQDWIQSLDSLGVGGKYNVKKVICACFGYWVTEHNLAFNVASRIKLPIPKARDVRCLFLPGEFTKIMSAAPEWMKFPLGLLHRTGARPAEIYDLQKDEILWAYEFAQKDKHKTRKLGKQRTIRFGKEDLLQLKVLADKSQDDYVLHGRDGGHLYVSYMGERFKEVCITAGLTEDRVKYLCPYSCRHSYIVDLLLAEVPAQKIASAVGHSSTRMIEAVYGHLADLVRKDGSIVARLEEYREKQQG